MPYRRPRRSPATVRRLFLSGRSAISRAATGIVPSASPRPAIAGSAGKRPACCRWPIRTSSSPCPNNWHRLHSATSACSTTCCFAPPPKPCSRSPLIHAISVHASGCSPYSIPGARTCATILTCIAWSPPVGSPSIIPAGSPADRASSCRCAYSAASSGARCWPSSSRLIRKENSVASAP